MGRGVEGKDLDSEAGQSPVKMGVAAMSEHWKAAVRLPSMKVAAECPASF